MNLNDNISDTLKHRIHALEQLAPKACEKIELKTLDGSFSIRLQFLSMWGNGVPWKIKRFAKRLLKANREFMADFAASPKLREFLYEQVAGKGKGKFLKMFIGY